MSVLFALLLSAQAVASAQQAPTIIRLPLELADFGIVADTVSGVVIVMQPSAVSKQNKDGSVLLRFHPDSALEWINSALAAITNPVAGAQAEGIQWSRTLVPANRKGAVAIGRSRKKGLLQQTHWLAIADSITGWRFELSGSQADGLLRGLLSAASQSRIDTTESAPVDESRTDRPVRILQQPKLPTRGRGGRVLAQWVVGTDGEAEPGSFSAYLATDPALVGEALDAVRHFRFQPAERGGRPVRQLVVWEFRW
jgi:hypothetical protein